MMDPTVSSCEGTIKTSVAVFLITLAASEVIIYVLCKVMAWYAHVTFYAAQGDMNWIHETDVISSGMDQNANVEIGHEPSLEDIQRALRTYEYSTERIALNEESCPICLSDFGKHFVSTVIHIMMLIHFFRRGVLTLHI